MTDPAEAELVEALVELHAAAARVRELLAEAAAPGGFTFRRLAAVTGLPLATLSRWRLEVPILPTLRAAARRRATPGRS